MDLDTIPLTAGQEVLKFLIMRLFKDRWHIIGDKIRQAYDKSQILDERKRIHDCLV